MAQRAAKLAKKPTSARLARAEEAVRARPEDALQAIPLKLAPLLAPFKKQGRLSLRVERVAQLARLSHGRNNGDGSWSLASDELEDLSYLVPEGTAEEEHTLAIRIIGLDGGDARTLAVVDYPLSPDAGDADADAVVPQQGATDSMQLRRLRDDLSKAKTELAERESELDEMRRTAEHADAEFAKQIETELTLARNAWELELDERLAAAAVEAAADLQERRETWKAEQNSRHTVSDQVANERLAEARERWQQETQDALTKAEKTWKAEEAARLAQAEAKWREKSSKAVAEGRAQGKTAQDQGAELRRLREDIETLHATLADRDAALAEAQTAREQLSQRRQRETEDALRNAERAWKSEEAARFSAAEAQWRNETAAAVAEARSETKAARQQAGQAELQRAREELAALQAALAERDTALSDAATASEEAREHSRRESEEALRNAEAAWIRAEAARFAAAEAQWQQEFAKHQAAASARSEKAEAALADARTRSQADAAAVRSQADGALRRLRDDCTRIQASLSDREAELAQARLEHEQARQSWKRDSEAAFSKAKTAWDAEADARLSAVEAQWREQSAKTLAAVTARCEKAEAAVTSLRADANADAVTIRDQADRALRTLRDECAKLQSALTDRETELAQSSVAHEQAREHWQQASDSAMSAAKTAWGADEAARSTAAETQWRKDSGRALTEALVRAETAETALANLRRADTSRDRSEDVVTQRLRDELAASQATLTERDAELARLRVAAGEAEVAPAGETRIVIQSNHERDLAAAQLEEQRRKKPGWRPKRAHIVAAAIAASVIVAYPYVRMVMPESVQLGASVSESDGAAPSTAETGKTLVIRDANVRSGPSTSASIVATVPRGRELTAVERRGNWTLVRIDAENGKGRPRQGWIFNASLKDADAAVERD